MAGGTCAPPRSTGTGGRGASARADLRDCGGAAPERGAAGGYTVLAVRPSRDVCCGCGVPSRSICPLSRLCILYL